MLKFNILRNIFNSFYKIIHNEIPIRIEPRKSIISKSIFIIALALIVITACSKKQLPKVQKNNFQQHIQILASDSLGGREAGTKYEVMARDYIASQFQQIGLEPFFNQTYYQAFPFKSGADYSKSEVWINGKKDFSSLDFQPLTNSKNDSITAQIIKVGYGIISSKPAHNDYPNHNGLEGKIFIIEASVPGGSAQFDLYNETADLDKRIELAEKFGAKGIVIINNDTSFNDPRKLISNRKTKTKIPVIIAKGELLKTLNAIDSGELTLKVEINKMDMTGYNVAGYLNNGKSKTIVVGAHYDHLGMGGETSRYFGSAIHNGADDNASGIAAIIELARFFKEHPIEANLLFVGFSAEEKGLYGSNFFVDQSIKPIKSQILCYINFDMIGRLNNNEKKLTIFGTGTSQEWDSIFKMSIIDSSLTISKSATGIGGSDQLPFYLDSIPVLFFFTGIHDDYHTPNDDEKFINYQGLQLVTDFSARIIEKSSQFSTMKWKATQARPESSGRSRGGLSMGIMPSYANEGGVLVDMVVEGKPGFIAGLQKGDIIIRIHESKINDVYDYMDVMKILKKETDYSMEIKRNGKTEILKLRF